MKVLDNISLEKYNTLHLISCAERYVQLTQVEQLPLLSDYVQQNKCNYFVLGGGSNLILPKEYKGLVIHNQLKGIQIVDDETHYLVTASSGEIWDDFVLFTVNHGCYGLENLSLIPGTVGASPIQNIGAYGVEVKDFIHQVEVFDLISGDTVIFTNQECNFKYRDSRFKKECHYLVTSVTFKLLKTPKLNITYGDLANNMASYQDPQPINLRNEVIKIRSSKLPDPKIIGNVGSFFHNPILCIEHANSLKSTYPKLPVYPISDTHMKVSAGWLIDNLGLKGYQLGKMAVYDKQALVLVNQGSATKDDVLNLANYIIEQVYTTYQIQLNIEPIQI